MHAIVFSNANEPDLPLLVGSGDDAPHGSVELSTTHLRVRDVCLVAARKQQKVANVVISERLQRPGIACIREKGA
jgi:hypothetical protein